MPKFLQRHWRLALFLLVTAGIVALVLATRTTSSYVFPGLSGPDKAPPVAAPAATLPDQYGKGGNSRLAILLTDTDSGWLGLAHGLNTIGVPFIVTRDPERALRHKVVLVYPIISGKVLPQAALQGLARHPRQGGTVIGFEILGGGLEDIFGFSTNKPSQTHQRLRFEDAAAADFGLEGALERDLPMAGPAGGMAGYAFEVSSGSTLARYDNGDTAVVGRDFGAGHSYAFGIDVGAFIAKAHNGRLEIGRSYANAYEPAVDIWLRVLRQIYRSAEPMAVTLDTIPGAKQAALILTHDIDSATSLNNALAYARWERANGVAATYFIQTKYVRDWNDEIFFNDRGAEQVAQLIKEGMDIGSHSVSHSLSFAKFELGSNQEAYPAYQPFVKSQQLTTGGTVLGELRVSRFLLEQTQPGLAVHSFRPGHLRNPFALPQALEATGYRYGSALASGIALTHLPFQLNYNRENSAETGIFEFPITLEDERNRPMTGRYQDALTILTQLQRYGGTCMLLVHPDVFDDKFAFLQQLVAEAKRRSLWIGALGQFAPWWVARNQVGVDVERRASGHSVTLHSTVPVRQLAMHVAKGWQLQPGSQGRQQGNTVIVDVPAGGIKLQFSSEKPQ